MQNVTHNKIISYILCYYLEWHFFIVQFVVKGIKLRGGVRKAGGINFFTWRHLEAHNQNCLRAPYSRNTQRIPPIIWAWLSLIGKGLHYWNQNFQFQTEYCNVPKVALFQIRNTGCFIIDIRRMFMCKQTVGSQMYLTWFVFAQQNINLKYFYRWRSSLLL